MERDQRHVQLGYKVFHRYFELSFRQNKNWTDFINSQFYNDFVKVGRFIEDNNPIRPADWIEFIVQSQRPVREWSTQAMYEVYLREITKKETPDAAFKRNVELMETWANANGEKWNDFFRKVAPAQATLWIKTGRISPWMFYLCESAGELMGRFSPEQIKIIEKYLEPDFWRLKLDKYPEDVAYYRSLCDEFGL